MRKRTHGFIRCLSLAAKFFTAGVVAAGVLSAVCLLVNYSGVRIANPSGSTDFKWLSHQYRSTAFEGFAWFKMDKNGFNNINVYKKGDIDILLMGSSHMEGANLPPDKTIAGRMDAALSQNVYNIGTSAHFFCTCVQNMEAAVRNYAPSDYVILETNSVELSCADMQKTIDGEYPLLVSHDSGIMFLLQKYVPAIKTIYKNIEDWSAIGKTTPSPAVAEEEDYEEILKRFLEKAVTPIKESGAQLIIFYHPKQILDENGVHTVPTDQEKLEQFKRQCAAADIVFFDMTDPFNTLYEEESTLAYGFANTAVGGGHLNEDGHRVIADTLIQYITENQ